MKFCSITSGSSGNCIFTGSDHTSVLIDAGLSGKRIEAGLQTFSMTTKDIDALLITHEHADHIKGAGILARRYDIPIYGTKGTLDALRDNPVIGKIPDELFHEIHAGEIFSIGDLAIRPFSISHDAAEPVGYRIEHEGKSAAVATDMGIATEEVEEALQKLDVLLLESNHDLRMLQTGRYPYYLKRRIMGETGHLSNDDAGRLLVKLLHEEMKYIFLGHLSEENNYEALAYETVTQEITLGDNPFRASDFDISIAHRERPGMFIEF